MNDDDVVVGAFFLSIVCGIIGGLVAVGFVIYGFTHSAAAYADERGWLDYLILVAVCCIAFGVTKWFVGKLIRGVSIIVEVCKR